MTIEQINETALKELPVVYEGITYQCITAIIKRKIKPKDKTTWIYQAELLDQCGHSVTIARPNKITLEVVTDENMNGK
jgi:hypothetical protein